MAATVYPRFYAIDEVGNLVDSVPRQRGTGRDKRDSMYVVAWADRGMVKVGFSSDWRRRTGSYATHGGAVLAVVFFNNCDDAFQAELDAKDVLSSYQRSFQSRFESTPFLGSSGSGWTECFDVPVGHHDVAAQLIVRWIA